MKRKMIQIIRIAAILIVSQLVIGTSVAGVFDDDLMKLQQEQFELDRQLRQEQFKLQQFQHDQFRLDPQLIRGQFNQMRQYRDSMKLQQQFQFQQQLTQGQFKQLQAPWQWDTVQTRIDSVPRIPIQSSQRWRSFEAAGLTHLSDHTAMFKRSTDLIRQGLSRPGLGPDTIAAPSGQLVWANRPVTTGTVEFLRGVSIGLHFGAALTRDWETMQKGNWSFPRSYTLEAAGTYGLGEIRNFARTRITTLGRGLNSPVTTFAAKWTYGLPDLAKGISSQIGRGSLRPNIYETTSYIEAVGMTAAGYAGGPPGAILFKASATYGRFATYPLFESIAMAGVRRQVLHDYSILRNSWEARGLPVQSLSEVYKPKYLRSIGFSSDITGLLPIKQRPNFFGNQQTTFRQVRSTPLNQLSNLNNTRIEQRGFLRETRVISTPTNAFDRLLIQTGFQTPNTLFDFKTGSTMVTRQWSITTSTISTPSMSVTPQWSIPQPKWNNFTNTQPKWNTINPQHTYDRRWR